MSISNYAYKKPHLRLAASVADRIGYLFRRPASSANFNPKRVLVIRLDQLGDIVQTLPLFDGIAASFPSAVIDFLTPPVGAELMRIARPQVRSVVWNCPWFDANRKPDRTWTDIKETLAEGNYDCVFELRGDVRLISGLKRAGIGPVVGYGATGGGFMLDVEPRWEANKPAIDKNLELLKAIGGHSVVTAPFIPAAQRADSRRIAVHPDAGAPAKIWPIEFFARTIERLLEEDFSVTLVGTNSAMGAALEGMVSRPLENLMGKTNLKQLLDALSLCGGLLSNDSGPAHLMAAIGRPVWVLWSMTALSSVWAPRGNAVKIIEPPQGGGMSDITVDRVVDAVRGSF